MKVKFPASAMSWNTVGCGGLDVQAAEHGSQFPVAKQHDGFGANVGTEQGCGAALPEPAHDFQGEDACL